MFVANNLNQFKALFVAELKNMLTDEELGAFILVLANSQQDEPLRDDLNKKLESTFIALKGNLGVIKQKSTTDDIDVFNKLLDSGVNTIPVWQSKKIGHWEVTYNAMRQLRPARASAEIFKSIKQDFDESRFHFNKSFLKPEVLWEGEYRSNLLRVLYNKFPFSDYHLLIAVSPEKNSPQLLTQEAHQLISSLVADYDSSLPGFGVGFNSIAAGASVNHLHFQGFLREQIFPVEADCWSHNGGDMTYPLRVKRFSDAGTSWEYINQLTLGDVAFNCLYRKNSCYVIPRKYQGAVNLPDWLQGAGWLDVAGVMTVSGFEIFSELDEQQVARALELL